MRIICYTSFAKDSSKQGMGSRQMFITFQRQVTYLKELAFDFY